MAQVFSRNANNYVKISFVAGGVITLALGGIIVLLYLSPAVTTAGINLDQPVPFSHSRHVAGNGIDCRYCHTTVEKSGFAGIPPTETCMTCHSQVLADAPMLAPVRESWKTGKPLEWTRVYDVPDFVYFDHSIHVAKGIGCTTCHGDIAKMELTHKAQPLRMSWCLDCHDSPEDFVRPKDKVFDPYWPTKADADFDQKVDGPRLVEEYGIRTGQLTDCSICHR